MGFLLVEAVEGGLDPHLFQRTNISRTAGSGVRAKTSSPGIELSGQKSQHEES